MNHVTSTSSRKSWADWLLVLVFGLLLWAPTVDYFGHVDWAKRPDENRMMAAKPKLTRMDFSGVREYLAASETCFNDHFGFRKRLIRLCQHWRRQIFHDKTERKVITGKNGWFFFSDLQMIDHYLGEEKFTRQRLQSWQRLLEKRRDWLAARGIKYLFVIPPDKHSIYSENLPDWLVKSTPAVRQTKLDQFFEYMKAHSTVEVLDLRPALLAGKKIAPIFLQNDTHWNMFGGFFAAQEIIQVLSRSTPALPVLRLEDFDWINAPWSGGDLTRMLGVNPPEKNMYYFTPKPSMVALTSQQELTNIVRNWNPHDKAKVNQLIENTNLMGKPDLVIFHDSFGGCWCQFFGSCFHRAVFIGENREFNAKVIADNHPQIVVNEMLERVFNTENPDEMLKKDALP